MASTQRVQSMSPKKSFSNRHKENRSPIRKIECIVPVTEIINEKVTQFSIEASHITAVQHIEAEAFWNTPAENIPPLPEDPGLDSSLTAAGAKLQIVAAHEDPNIREDLKKAAQVQPPVTSAKVHSNESAGTSGANSPQPSIEISESETILKLDREMEELILGDDKCAVSGVGLGDMKSGNDIFRKSSLPNGKLRPQKARLPSWKAAATEPEAKIDESLRKIKSFLATIQEEVKDLNTAERNSKFKLFIEASKQIVSAWPLLHGDLFKGLEGQLLSEKVDCIHAIHLAWDEDATRNTEFLDQGLDMAAHCEDFGRQWETLTGRDLGITRKRVASAAGGRKSVEKVDSNEKMEYIPPAVVSISTPKAKDALKNPRINLSLENNIKNGSGNIHDPAKLEDRLIAPFPKTIFSPKFRAVIDSQNPTEISSAILREHLKNCNTLTPIPVHDALSLHDRLERLENILQYPQQQIQTSMNLILGQQTAMIQEVHDAIFGEWEKTNPEQNSDKRIIAKRTGLLMMAKFMSDWKEEYGPKVGRLENTICGKKSDVNTGLVGAHKRVEDKIDVCNASVATLKQTIPENFLGIQKEKAVAEEDRKTMMWMNWTLEDENRNLKAEIGNLKAPVVQNIAGVDMKVTTGEESIELKKQVDMLQDAVRALQVELKERDNTKHWADEAWDSAMDAYWPQGNPTFESYLAEPRAGAGMITTTMGESDKPALNKASRGSGTGSVGACIVM